MEFLKELRYVPYVATNRRLTPYEQNPRAGINFLFVPKEREAELVSSP
jgi:hypothetical protein